jgi:hypothetical protein
MHPLVEEAAKKAAVAWLGFGDGPSYAVWCLPLSGKLYVVTGPGEQPVPGLAEAVARGSGGVVTLRGDHGGNIVTFAAAIAEIRPNSTEWEAVAPQLAGKRLNASGTTEAVVARWARDCLIVALVPNAVGVSAGPDLPADSQAQAPRPAPVVRATRKPFKLHRVRKTR